jgi:hypothetical protein
MAVIQSGTNSNLMEVNGGLSAQVTLYGADGNPLVLTPDGSYMTSFEVRHTGAPAAGTTVFNMRGPSTKTARIRRISGHIGFSGVATIATLLRYGFYRGSGAASPTGGTAKSASNGKKRGATNWAAQDIRCDLVGAGLTTTSITYEADPLYVVGVSLLETFSTGPATALGWTAPQVHFDIELSDAPDLYRALDLTTSDHFAIRVQTVSAIIGLFITGGIEWDEIT